MSKSIAESNSETVCGLDIPESVATQLRQEHERRDVALVDLLNDYLMLHPSVTLSVQDRR